MATLTADRATDTIKVVDVDALYSEPEDLWTKRAPARFKDRVPQIGKVNGQVSWVIDGNHPIGLGASASCMFDKSGRPSDGLEFTTWRAAEVHPSAYSVWDRLELMDDAHVHADLTKV